MTARGTALSLISVVALIVTVGVGSAALRPTASTSDDPDGLILPPGFHATVVAEALGAIRHIAVAANGNIYSSTPIDQQGNGKGSGIIALQMDASHKAMQVQHFSSVDGGTGIRFYNGALY